MSQEGEEFERYRNIGRSLVDKYSIPHSNEGMESNSQPNVTSNKTDIPEGVPDNILGQKSESILSEKLKQTKYPYKTMHTVTSNEMNNVPSNQNQEHDDDNNDNPTRVVDHDDMNDHYFGKYSDLNNLRNDFDQLNLSGNLSDNNSFHLHAESLSSISSSHDDLERKRKELLRLNKSIDLVNKT